MSPILTRPIREQLEHDRIIRELQARYKRKHEVAINPGMEQNQSVMVGDLAVFPDLLLYSQERGRRLEGTVEVETGESVNQLEALAEWGLFSKLKAPFYLYVPPQSVESARRICDEHQFPVAEIWTYHLAMDQVRFTQIWRSPNAPKLPPASRPLGPEKTVVARASDNGKPAARKTLPKTAAATNDKPKADKPAKHGKAAKARTPVKLARATKLARPARMAKSPAKAAKPAGRAGARPVVAKKRR